MNRKWLAGIILLMSVALAGIVAVQWFWIKNAIRVEQEEFNRKVQSVLTRVVNKLETGEEVRLITENIIDSPQNQIAVAPVPPAPPAPPDNNLPILPIPVMKHDSSFKMMMPLLNLKKRFFNDSDFSRTELIQMDSSGKNKLVIKSIFSRKDIAKKARDIHSQVLSFTDSEFAMPEMAFVFRDSNFSRTADKLCKIDRKESKIRSVIHKIVREYTLKDVPLAARLRAAGLDSLIENEVQKAGIKQNFSFAVMDAKSKELITKSPRFRTADIPECQSAALFPNDVVDKSSRLLICFPDQTIYVLQSLRLMLGASGFFTLVMLLTFGLTLHTILKQKKISEIKSDFINNMTHEFKTPIATISLALDAIRNPAISGNPERVSHYTTIIGHENQRMNKQVENILQMALLDRGEFSLNKDFLNIHSVLRQAASHIRLQVEERGGELNLNLNAKNTGIQGDAVQLCNAFLNLLDNANKYSSAKPEIEVTSMDVPGGIEISFTDKGMGMSPEVLRKIFEKFYRKPSGNIHNVKGYGLGLSYVKAILQLHGGNINVRSEPGKGSIFRLFLPSAPENI